MKTILKIFLTLFLIGSICLLALSATLNQITTQIVALNLSDKVVSDKVLSAIEKNLPNDYAKAAPVVISLLNDDNDYKEIISKYIDAISAAVTSETRFIPPNIEDSFDKLFHSVSEKTVKEVLGNQPNEIIEPQIAKMESKLKENKTLIIMALNRSAESVVNDKSSTQTIIKTYSTVNSFTFKLIGAVIFVISFLLCWAISKSFMKSINLLGIAFLVSGILLVFLVSNLLIGLISGIATSYAGYNIVVDAAAIRNLGIVSLILGIVFIIIAQAVLMYRSHKDKKKSLV